VAEPSPESSQPTHTVICPVCEGPVEIPQHLAEHSLVCPHCGQGLEPGAGGPSDAAEGSAPEPGESAELDANRIRKLARLKRAADRTASYLIIVLVACVVGAAELIYDAGWRLEHQPAGLHSWFFPTIYLLAGLLLMRLALMFFRLARDARQKARESMLTEPQAEPDFSTLQDGSQTATHLEQMQMDPNQKSEP
jgi:hypothetical protein